MIIIVFFFWVWLWALMYIYVGYPVCAFAVSLFRRMPVAKETIEPTVTIITSAYNERDHIEETIRNKFSQDYPQAKLRYIVVSDASDDGTDDVVVGLQKEFPNLIFLRQNTRKGKTAALNRAIAYVSEQLGGELPKEELPVDSDSRENEHIIVFADANSMYAPDAIRQLVRNFGDSSVGYVTGKMVYLTQQGSSVSEGCSAYMKYENVLRGIETKIGSIVGVDGGIDAVRLSLYTPMEDDALPDFELPLSVVRQGNRVVYEPRAVLREKAHADSKREFSMRVRVALRSYRTIFANVDLLRVRDFGFFSWQFLSHKVMRYDAGFYQCLAFIFNVLLIRYGMFYYVLLILQELFYAAAFLGWWLDRNGKKIKLFYFPYYLCLLNIASIVAFSKFVRGEKKVTWNPRD